MRSFKQRPSAAMTVACMALFVAMGGTGYATTQLSTAKAKHKKAKALTKADVNKLIAAYVAAHKDELRGAAGQNGTNAAASVVTRNSSKFMARNGSTQTVTADCVAGEKAVGGGAAWSNPPTINMHVVTVYPSGPNGSVLANGATPTHWSAEFENDQPTVDNTAYVYVVCASP
jgi:hypothetical protein